MSAPIRSMSSAQAFAKSLHCLGCVFVPIAGSVTGAGIDADADADADVDVDVDDGVGDGVDGVGRGIDDDFD